MKCANCGFEFEGSFCPNCGGVNNAAPQQGYAAPQPQYGNAGYNAPAPIEERNLVTCIILSIVTCGIYGIIWFIKLTDDANAVSTNTKTASGGMAFLYTLISCSIYGYYWAYKQGEKIAEAKAARGQMSDNASIVYLLLTIFGLGIVAYALMQNELNNLAH